MNLDRYKTMLQENGVVVVAGLTVQQIAEIVMDLGLTGSEVTVEHSLLGPQLVITKEA